MELTTKNVELVFNDCLLSDEEIPKSPIIFEDKQSIQIPFAVGEGVKSKFGFNKDKVNKHAKDINDMLEQLPDEFFVGKGGGWSFLNMCKRKDGIQWADFHETVDLLIMLGNAIGSVSFTLPRQIWNVLPGGMPYVQIDIK